MVELIEADRRLDLVSPMPWGKRLLIAAVGLVPLIAPYELLVQVRWQSYLNPFFLMALMVSIGALAVSAFFLFAAIAGLASRITMDATSSTLSYSHVAPAVPRFTKKRDLESIDRLDIRTHEWSDGPDSYSLRIVTSDGTEFETASSWSKEDITRIKEAAENFLSRHINAAKR